MELYDNIIFLSVFNFLVLLTSTAQIHQWQNSLVDSIQYGRGFTSSEKPFTTMKPLYILSQCEKRCLSSSRCVYLTFDSKEETCKLFSDSPSKSSIQKGPATSAVLLKTEITQPQDYTFACHSSPCKNGGRCLEGDEENGTFFQCVCANGWNGKTCEEKVELPKWTDWEEWSPCSSQCGSGWRRRRRTCIKPDTQKAVDPWMCQGTDHEFEECTSGACPKLEPWGDWSPCSSDINCGEGQQTRNRSCSSSVGGWPCAGPGQESRPCQSVKCNAPVKLAGTVYGSGRVEVYDTKTEKWGAVCADNWDAKNTEVICRQLGLVPPTEDKHSFESMQGNSRIVLQDISCDGTEGALVECNHAPLWANDGCVSAVVIQCEVNGGWGTWSKWGPCSVSCDNGTKIRTRDCDFPSPTPGGAKCSGTNQDMEECFMDCSGNGQWGDWGSWSECSNKCGDGIKTRSRPCDNPPPAEDGLPCEGSDIDEAACTDNSKCSVDGTYGPWSDWGACSVTCGNGTQGRSRECTGVAFGGKDCQGPPEEVQECFPVHCPVDGYYEDWQDWGECSVTCGNGTQVRERTCVEPKYGGADCVGEALQSQECFPRHCPVDGVFSDWSDWTSCSATCGPGGKQVRNRTCEGRAYGGKDCDGAADEVKDCYVVVCPVDGQWSEWSDWSPCSHSCGEGTKARNRTCEGTIGAGKPCDGDALETEPCTTSCTKPGEWMTWGEWGRCSVTCGGGERQRMRECNMTTWGDMTDPCEGPSTDTKTCNSYSCTPLETNCELWKEKGMEENAFAQIDVYNTGNVIIWAYCNVEGEGYTEIRTKVTGEIKVEGFEGRGSYEMKVDYNATENAKNIILGSARHCKQYLSWRCRSSYMINPNAKGGADRLARMTFWLSRNGKEQPYWPGGDPDTIGCACSLDNSCDGGAKWCNCDAGDDVEHVDDGYVEDKTLLPISGIQAGDTGDDGEVGFITIGNVQCKGVGTDQEFMDEAFPNYYTFD